MAFALHFDVLGYVEKAEKLGIPNEVAKFQAREMENLYATTVDGVNKEIQEELINKKLATKGDVRESELKLQKEIEIVRKEIAQSKNQVIIWVAGMFVASGILQHFFK